jgi:hypothetical protein
MFGFMHGTPKRGENFVSKTCTAIWYCYTVLP